MGLCYNNLMTCTKQRKLVYSYIKGGHLSLVPHFSSSDLKLFVPRAEQDVFLLSALFHGSICSMLTGFIFPGNVCQGVLVGNVSVEQLVL